MSELPCTCREPGLCPVYNRPMQGRAYDICSGAALTPEQQAVYRRNWLAMAGQPLHPDYCIHRGPQLRTETCHVCGNRGKSVPVFKCDLKGSCSYDLYQIGQREQVCRHCDDKVGPVKALWDRKIEKLIPSPDGQNFNNSLIEFRGRRIMAYRHRWGGSRLGLCELNSDWQVIWNCLLSFPGNHPHNVYQEDPRLFIFKGELHVAYTAVQVAPRTVTHVGYARLREVAPSTWSVEESFLPHYEQRQAWEKNWGFFESQGQLWAVYDAGSHTILSIDGNRATPAYQHTRPIAGDWGLIRGGAAPQFWRGEFYSFVHFRKNPKNYAGGLYTFDAQPPFAPTGYIPYPILSPTAEHCSQPSAANVVYPSGAALLDWRWVVSYGAYDRDSRLCAYDVNQVKAALVRSRAVGGQESAA